jgi:hypothetical protein
MMWSGGLMSAARLEKAIAKWLDDQVTKIAADILGSQVTTETYEIRKAERRAYLAMRAKLPDLVKQATE